MIERIELRPTDSRYVELQDVYSMQKRSDPKYREQRKKKPRVRRTRATPNASWACFVSALFRKLGAEEILYVVDLVAQHI